MPRQRPAHAPRAARAGAAQPIPLIRNYRVSHIAEVVASGAVDAAHAARARAILDGFDTGALLTLPVQQMLEMLEAVAQAAGIDDLGLRVGARYHPADWGAYGYLFLNSPTVLQALRSWVRVTREEQQGAHARLALLDEGIRVEYAVLHPAQHRRRQDAEMTLAVLLQAVRTVAGAATVPRAVLFEHPRPRHTAPHRAFFRAPLHFGAGVNALLFDRRLGATPIPNADARLFGVISGFVGRSQPLPSGQSAIVDLVQVALRALLGADAGAATLQTVSRRLGMSQRTVQRRLAEAGSSFDDCRERLRRAWAEELLADDDLEIKEIAFLLGYSGSAAFVRAHRRWTGMPPQRHRAARAQPPAAPR